MTNYQVGQTVQARRPEVIDPPLERGATVTDVDGDRVSVRFADGATNTVTQAAGDLLPLRQADRDESGHFVFGQRTQDGADQ